MYAKPIQALIELFLKFPGVGPRQAARFVFYLLGEDPAFARRLGQIVGRLREDVQLCADCYKTFDGGLAGPGATLCEICRNSRRTPNQILVVEKEADLENIERGRAFEGRYHVLGGTIDPLDSSAPVRLHVRELVGRIRLILEQGGQAEVIIATNPTVEGDATALYLDRTLAALKREQPGLKVSRLGRGLSTGSELEYADELTIASALVNRKAKNL